MNVGSICSRNVVTIAPSEDLSVTANVMREKHVGYLVVVEPMQDGQSGASAAVKPVGVVTDRDLVITVVAKGADPRALNVEDVMTRELVIVREDDSMDAALIDMRRSGVRRAPVLGRRNQLVGVVSIDDMLRVISNELANVVGSIRNEQRIEEVLRP